MKTSSLFRALAARIAAQPRRARRRELQMETLEDRVLLSIAPQPPAPQPPHVSTIAVKNPAPAQHAQPNNNQTISWIGGDGFWDDAAKWSTGTVPDNTDDVTIDPAGGPFTITIRTQVAAKTLQCAENLTITGGNSLTLTSASAISGALSINGDFTTNGALALSGTTTWNVGVLGGTGTITNSGTFTKANNNLSLLTNLTNTGTLNLGGGATGIDTGKAITNQVGGTLNLSADFSNGGPGLIFNAGTLNSTGTPTIGGALNNTGTVHVTAGTLTLRNGGTSSGILNVDAGATLAWLDGTGTGTFLLATGAQTNGMGVISSRVSAMSGSRRGTRYRFRICKSIHFPKSAVPAMWSSRRVRC